MASVNKAIIIGNLGKDPELKHTTSGTAVVTLSVATTDGYTDKAGNNQEKTEWHRVTAWGKTAENAAKYLSKGRTVYVEGRIETEQWQDKTTGEKKYRTGIVATSIVFLGGGKSEGARQEPYSREPSPPSGAASDWGQDEDIPF